MTTELTVQQRELLLFLEDRSEKGLRPPTYRDICKHFHYRSTQAAVDLVAALERKGVVTREKGSARGIQLVRRTTGIPMLGRIAAGSPREALTSPDERLNLDPAFCGIRNRSRAFALRVTGDSMVGRQITEGDIVVLEHDATPRDGDIVAALIDNQSTLKTFVLHGGKVWLRAENPLYRDLAPAVDLQIQGVGRAVIRFLNK